MMVCVLRQIVSSSRLGVVLGGGGVGFEGGGGCGFAAPVEV